MLKKALSLLLVVALTATIAITGTVAYLQSEDSDVNVMTLGSVMIEQHEYQRAEGGSHINSGAQEGDLVPFVQNQPLYPAVPTADDAYEAEQAADRCFHWGVYSPGWNGLWDDSKLANVMDKFVFVENTGKSDAYYRTLIALECPEGMTIGYSGDDEINVNINGNSRFDWDYSAGHVTIEGTRYEVWCVTYTDILTPGEVSRPSLLQVVMTHNATNEDMEKLGDTYEILVLSQAVQTEGFADAKTALDTAFGKPAEKAAEWFDAVIVPQVKTVAELREAMATGGEFALANDIVVESTDLLYKADGGHSDGSAFLIKADTVIDLNGHNITVDAPSHASDVFFVNGGHVLTVKGNGTVTADCGIFVSYSAADTINIEGGNYKCTAGNDMLYAIWGKLNVSGGTYESAYWNLINIYGQGNISLVDVSGGSFKNWSPASSPDGNLLADGYKVVSEVVDGVTWYTVVAE